MGYASTHHSNKKRALTRWLLLGLLLVGATLTAVYLLFNNNGGTTPPTAPNSITEQSEAREDPPYEPVNLQPIIEQWDARQAATYSIVVYDMQSKSVIGSILPDREYFAASLYKQYVAYLALLDIQNGAMDPDEILWGSYSRMECIDRMIRESHSPCGEAMMADIGQTRS